MDELQPRDFSFNAPYGACPDCSGIGSREEVDASLVVPDPSLTLSEGAIAPFKERQLLPSGPLKPLHCIWAATRTPRGRTCPKKSRRLCSKAWVREKVRVDYTTVDGRNTYWFIEWEGALPR